jgi:hypothetical protein
VVVPAVLLFGSFPPSIQEQVSHCVSDAGFELQEASSTSEITDRLSESMASCLLVNHAQAEAACAALRVQSRFGSLPIISLAPAVSELALVELFCWGGEDVVCWDRNEALSNRLRRLPKAAPAPGVTEGRTALVAATDRTRRVVLARVLLNAGYAIQFAADPEETEKQVRQNSPRLVVVDTDDEAFWTRLQALAPTVQSLFVLSTSPRNVRSCAVWASQIPNLALTDSFAPPENVVFLSNELGRSGTFDQRGSRRMLYGTCIAFRPAGRDVDDFGLTYNVSERGLYIRSLAPPVDDLVWLELTPPRTDRRVRLEAKVRWRRGYGPSTQATAPPGFGLEISDGARVERETWKRGYTVLREAFGR